MNTKLGEKLGYYILERHLVETWSLGKGAYQRGSLAICLSCTTLLGSWLDYLIDQPVFILSTQAFLLPPVTCYLPPPPPPISRPLGIHPMTRVFLPLSACPWQHFLSLWHFFFLNSISLQKCLPTSDGSFESFAGAYHISLPEKTIWTWVQSLSWALSCSALTYTGKADKIHKSRTYRVLGSVEGYLSV